MQQDTESNKRNAIAFYRTAYLGDPAKAVELYVGADYIQHNPLVGDGKAAFIEYFNEMAKNYPIKVSSLSEPRGRRSGCAPYASDLARKPGVRDDGFLPL